MSAAHSDSTLRRGKSGASGRSSYGAKGVREQPPVRDTRVVVPMTTSRRFWLATYSQGIIKWSRAVYGYECRSLSKRGNADWNRTQGRDEQSTDGTATSQTGVVTWQNHDVTAPVTEGGTHELKQLPSTRGDKIKNTQLPSRKQSPLEV